MKKFSIILITAVAVLAIMSAFMRSNHFKSGIYGTIDPPEVAKKVWAISGRDSVSAIPVTGKFSLEVKPGNWRLVVEAMQPYKNLALDNVLVQDNQFTDAGVIRLQR